MIRIKDLSFSFAGTDSPVLRRVNLDFQAGEFALISGPTGSGKSTFLRALTGLVPFYSSGQLSGEIWVNETQLAGRQPHEFSHLVGYVNQQPEGAFVSETVIEELAFGMEQLGFPEAEIDKKLDYFADIFGLKGFLNNSLESLSGGQQQRVAIAAALACGQKVLLLDEPTSALDVVAADELISLLRMLCAEQGITVLLAEHRIERAIGMVDSVCVIHGDGSATKAMVRDGLDPILRDYRMVPPVIELGQHLEWTPLPLNVAAAKAKWQEKPGVIVSQDLSDTANPEESGQSLVATGLSVSYGDRVALVEANISMTPGLIQAIMGPNGSGKTSLLWAIQGSLKHKGTVLLPGGTNPQDLTPVNRVKHIAMVPQTAADLLVMNSVRAELEDSDSFANAPAGTTAKSFSSMTGRIDPNRHPHDLSAGQQLALVLAIQLAKGAPNLLLDEPTRGLDYQAKRELATQLSKLAEQGKAVLLASHDVEFVALVASQVSLIRDGRIVDSGSAGQVLARLGTHAPQVLQITGKALRVEQVMTP